MIAGRWMATGSATGCAVSRSQSRSASRLEGGKAITFGGAGAVVSLDDVRVSGAHSTSNRLQHVQPKPAACSSVSIRLPKVHIWPSWSREKIVLTSWPCDKVEFTCCRKELSSSNVIATARAPLGSSSSDEILVLY